MPRQKKKKKKNDDSAELPLSSHLRELRNVLIASFLAVIAGSVVGFVFFDPIVAFLYEPFKNVQSIDTANTLFVNHLFEGFMTKLKIAIFSGLVLASPVIIFTILRFLFPAFNKKERRMILLTLTVSAVLVLLGFYYSYYTILPVVIKFFTSVGFLPENVGVLLNYQSNIIYIFKFILLIMVTFQFPVLLEMMMVTNMIERRTLLKFSRYVVVGVFLVAAIITPPDFISQCMIALPMMVLYFLALMVAKIFKFGEGEKA